MRAIALAVMAMLPCLLLPARAQQTMSEEMKTRARLMEIMPADAAKRHFGGAKTAAAGDVRTIGSYAKGCLAGATALALDGPTWQVMRTSRNRNWGHPELIALVERLAKRGPKEANWPGLLVGDISQPRGGPMLTGHASHQVGLDADIWLTPMPPRTLNEDERENMAATNAVAADWMDVDPKAWTPAHRDIVRLAALEPRVTRIFVNPAIKKAMCRDPGRDREWLTKVRPMWGHNYHFHIRIACPAGDAACIDQDPPPEGDGCGKELSDWLALQHKTIFGPKKPKDPNAKPKPPVFMPLSAMPEACQQIVLRR
ncbi:MAG TPA: penicillin-insensitive murein endopeptidase [Beijerinckiaceae bacterium]|nr:penicillin-insensitive murein endopeptidase [Beijerinckiaceae bacterium]